MGSGKRVVAIDYEMCNLDSVVRAVEECGGDSVVTREPKVLDQGTHLILPGVGAFADAMANLRRLGLAAALQEQVLEKRIPVLGVCLGMQLLARRGDEGGETPGLALLPAEVRRLRSEVDDATESERPQVRNSKANPPGDVAQRVAALIGVGRSIRQLSAPGTIEHDQDDARKGSQVTNDAARNSSRRRAATQWSRSRA